MSCRLCELREHARESLDAADKQSVVSPRNVALGLVLYGAAVGLGMSEAEQHATCNDCLRALRALKS